MKNEIATSFTDKKPYFGPQVKINVLTSADVLKTSTNDNGIFFDGSDIGKDDVWNPEGDQL